MNNPIPANQTFTAMLKLREQGLVIMPEAADKKAAVSGYLNHDWTDTEFANRVNMLNPNDACYSILTGSRRGHYMVVDCDGPDAVRALYTMLSSDEYDTLTIASWDENSSRSLIFQVPPLYQDLMLDFNQYILREVDGQKFKRSYQKPNDSKQHEQGIEFRYNNLKQTIAGLHQSGHRYRFINGIDSNAKVKVAPLPIAFLRLLIEVKVNPMIGTTLDNPTSVNAMLNYLPGDWKEPYDKWFKVGCAFHAAGLAFEDWMEWSKPSKKFDPVKTPKEAKKSWDAMQSPKDLESQNRAFVDMAVLSKIAEKHGWKPTVLDLNNDINAPFIIREVTKLLLAPIDEPTLALELQKIKRQFKLDGGGGEYSFNAFVQKLKKRIQLENDFQTDVIYQLEKWISEDLDIEYILPGALGPAMHKMAQRQSTEPEYLLGVFLSAAASRMGLKATFRSGYSQKPIFWFMFLAESGMNKSGTLEAVIKPLQLEQRDLTKQYQEAYKNWVRANDKKQDPPVENVRMVSKYSIVELLNILVHAHEKGQGLLSVSDELSRQFYQQEGVLSDTMDLLLELYNGGFLDRRTSTNGSSILESSAFSMTGATQIARIHDIQKQLEPGPGAFRDDVGMMARFGVCCKRGKERFTDFSIPEDETSEMLFSSLMKKVFDKIDQLQEREYQLSTEAMDLHSVYSNYIVELDRTIKRLNISKYIRKLPGRCLRLAGILHVIECAVDASLKNCDANDCNHDIISADTVAKAIMLCNYFYRQMLVLNALTDKNPDVTIQAFQIYNAAVSKDRVCARDIKDMLPQFADVDDATIRTLFEFLVKEKFAETKWEIVKPKGFGDITSEELEDPSKSQFGVLYLTTRMSVSEQLKLREKLKSWILVTIREEKSFTDIWAAIATRFKAYDPKSGLGDSKQVCRELLDELVVEGYFLNNSRRYTPVPERLENRRTIVSDLYALVGEDFSDYLAYFKEFKTVDEDELDAIQDNTEKASD